MTTVVDYEQAMWAEGKFWCREEWFEVRGRIDWKSDWITTIDRIVCYGSVLIEWILRIIWARWSITEPGKTSAYFSLVSCMGRCLWTIHTYKVEPTFRPRCPGEVLNVTVLLPPKAVDDSWIAIFK